MILAWPEMVTRMRSTSPAVSSDQFSDELAWQRSGTAEHGGAEDQERIGLEQAGR